MRRKKWYKLDNVGKFYSSIADSEAQKVFRYSATLIDEIDESFLQEALNETIEIYPYFNVNLKKGLFWYYLDETNRTYKVSKENTPICYKIYSNSNDFLYRINYHKNRINFEISHIVSDGRGSIDFFKTLISSYVRLRYDLKNIDISTHSSYVEKSEDSFEKYYKKVKFSGEHINNVYRYRAKKYKNQTQYLEAHMDVKKVLKEAHRYKSTLTAFLVSVLIYSFKDILSEEELKKTIRIEIPVDLRNYFKSSSSKNYFGLTSVSYTFNSREDRVEDIIKCINKQLSERLTKEELIKRVNRMITFERNVFCRVVPIFIKNIVLNYADKYTAKMRTTCVSNIGYIELDDEISSYIKNINVLTSTKDFRVTLCTFKDDLSIGVASRFKYNEVIKKFFNYFSNQGIDIIMNVSEFD